MRWLLLTLCLYTGRATHLQVARLHGPSPRSYARQAQASFAFQQIGIFEQYVWSGAAFLVMDGEFLIDERFGLLRKSRTLIERG